MESVQVNKKFQRTRKILLNFFIVIAILFAGQTIVSMMVGAKKAPKIEDAADISAKVLVKKSTLVRDSIRVESFGEVAPKHRVELVNEVSGKIVWMSEDFEEGRKILSKEVLLKLDPFERELSVRKAQASVARSKVKVERERANSQIAIRERTRAGDEQITALGSGLLQLREAEAEFESANADLSVAKLNLERTNLSVPFDGIVTERRVSLGTYLPAPGNRLATVVSADDFRINVSLNDEQLWALGIHPGWSDEVGLKANISTDISGEVFSWSGRLVSVNSNIDENSRTSLALVQIDAQKDQTNAPFSIPVSSYAKVEIQSNETYDMTAIPESGYLAGNRVIVVNEDNILQERMVQAMAVVDGVVWLRSGVLPNEMVVVSAVRKELEGKEVVPIDLDQRFSAQGNEVVQDEGSDDDNSDSDS